LAILSASNNRFERSRGGIFGGPRRGIDDWDKVPSFFVSAAARRSTSSLDTLIKVGSQDSLTFRLAVEDGWPPVAAECMPCAVDQGGFRMLAAPLFVRELSLDDIISITEEENGQIWSWQHIYKSANSTVWFLTIGDTSIEEPLVHLTALGCSVVRFPVAGVISLNVPPSVSADLLDSYFAGFTVEELKVAYPSWRHQDV
jgi:hypothetical protein